MFVSVITGSRVHVSVDLIPGVVVIEEGGRESERRVNMLLMQR